MRGWLLALMLGCGFQGIENVTKTLDGSIDSARPEADFAGVDLAGADFAVAPGIDLAVTDLAKIATGPGPLGALPSGYCCNNRDECRSRECVTSTSPGYCTDECTVDQTCSVWGPGFACDQGSGRCAPTSMPYSCHPADQYQGGSKATGTCCQSGIPNSGQECLGGLCVTTGNDANPFACTQGCDGNTPCPDGYSCFISFCWISQTVFDPNYLYTCQ